MVGRWRKTKQLKIDSPTGGCHIIGIQRNKCISIWIFFFMLQLTQIIRLHPLGPKQQSFFHLCYCRLQKSEICICLHFYFLGCEILNIYSTNITVAEINHRDKRRTIVERGHHEEPSRAETTNTLKVAQTQKRGFFSSIKYDNKTSMLVSAQSLLFQI